MRRSSGVANQFWWCAKRITNGIDAAVATAAINPMIKYEAMLIMRTMPPVQCGGRSQL
jgi:hypothetical protein